MIQIICVFPDLGQMNSVRIWADVSQKTLSPHSQWTWVEMKKIVRLEMILEVCGRLVVRDALLPLHDVAFVCAER